MGSFPDYERLDAVGLAGLVRRGETTPDELLDAAIERAERLNPKINAIVRPMYEEARAAIAAGLPDGPLRGVPFLLKDLHALYAGVPTTNGSALFREAVADHDTEIVARYRRAGLVIFGKTNTPELGLSASTEPRLFGPARNPWSLEHTTGGSSGGAAAAVAARIVPAAHASDGGGSIRIPASCCGLFGLKPTRGRNPMGPDAGEGWAGMTAQHAVSRTVRDSAALLDSTHGPETGDPYAAPAPVRPFLEEVGAPPGRLRIAVMTEPVTGTPVDPECVRAATDAAALCKSLGHAVEEASPEIDAGSFRQHTSIVIAANVHALLTSRCQELGKTLAAGEVERVTWTLAELGAGASASDYAAAVKGIHRVGRQVARFFLDYDILLSPMLGRPPIRLGILDMMSTDRDGYIESLTAFTAFSQLMNATGQPAMSVPLHWSASGLPIGVQFAGRFGDEATLFRLGSQLEAARPWNDRRPPLVV